MERDVVTEPGPGKLRVRWVPQLLVSVKLPRTQQPTNAY